MRRPLAGGGMTVALHDVVLLRGLLSHVDDLTDWKRIRQVLYQWHWSRKPLTATVNILSVSLHYVSTAESLSGFIRHCPMILILCLDEELLTIRTGCYKYLERGGECVNGPVSLLSAYVNVALDDLANSYLGSLYPAKTGLYAIWGKEYTGPTHARISPLTN